MYLSLSLVPQNLCVYLCCVITSIYVDHLGYYTIEQYIRVNPLILTWYQSQNHRIDPYAMLALGCICASNASRCSSICSSSIHIRSVDVGTVYESLLLVMSLLVLASYLCLPQVCSCTSAISYESGHACHTPQLLFSFFYTRPMSPTYQACFTSYVICSSPNSMFSLQSIDLSWVCGGMLTYN